MAVDVADDRTGQQGPSVREVVGEQGEKHGGGSLQNPDIAEKVEFQCELAVKGEHEHQRAQRDEGRDDLGYSRLTFGVRETRKLRSREQPRSARCRA